MALQELENDPQIAPENAESHQAPNQHRIDCEQCGRNKKVVGAPFDSAHVDKRTENQKKDYVEQSEELSALFAKHTVELSHEMSGRDHCFRHFRPQFVRQTKAASLNPGPIVETGRKSQKRGRG